MTRICLAGYGRTCTYDQLYFDSLCSVQFILKIIKFDPNIFT